MSVTTRWGYVVPNDLTPAELKDAMKTAIKEWMTEQWNTAARWTFWTLMRAAAVAVFGALIWLLLTANGWHQGK